MQKLFPFIGKKYKTIKVTRSNSLLYNISKAFEKSVQEQLDEYFSDLLSKCQFQAKFMDSEWSFGSDRKTEKN